MGKNNLPWQDKALNIISEKLFLEYTRVTGEDVRYWLAIKRHRAPIHPGAYGAMIRRAVELGYLKPSSKMVASRTPSSHARARRDYIVVVPAQYKQALKQVAD